MSDVVRGIELAVQHAYPSCYVYPVVIAGASVVFATVTVHDGVVWCTRRKLSKLGIEANDVTFVVVPLATLHDVEKVGCLAWLTEHCHERVFTLRCSRLSDSRALVRPPFPIFVQKFYSALRPCPS